MTPKPMRNAERETVGDWIFDRAAGVLERPGTSRRLEPKVADLLALLIDRVGTVVSRADITEALWPDVVVGDDALPRSVSKLRKGLDDDPKAPRYVETVPKRGYRLIASVGTADASGLDSSPIEADDASRGDRSRRRSRVPASSVGLAVGLAALAATMMLVVDRRDARTPSSAASPDDAPAARLTEQAEEFYFQIDRVGNESAIELYERALAADPDYAGAHAGLANALVQRVLRYPASDDAPPIDRIDLDNALAAGRFDTAEARLHLDRALGLAERAVRLAPDDAASHKALGFVHSARGRSDVAIASYERALALDADAWDAAINLGDLHEIRGDDERALAYFEQTYAAMTRVYAEQSARVRPWYAEMGATIGIRHEDAGRPEDAESWYRRVLAHSPFHPTTTCALARLLRRSGDAPAADRLVDEMAKRTAVPVDCAERLAWLEHGLSD